ncbi:hypothetical protein V5P93_000682 [Actinokineospora auranticolor]|uniref:Uncharacterized protein n=1 Tax=Actinokineospora auranticolor TaxID=155976 RepID=A0A2S6GZ47_9PSEU|nr:hypothetical protein [Actinokineospora auranticolor]PPK70437.1 hypothetical protein CLV40_102352 [Actinokineospora auranticolor]
MPFSSSEFAAELRLLRKGRGVDGRIVEVVGPALRVLCGVGVTDGAAAVRERVKSTLVELTARLPDDLREIVRTALALPAPGERHAPFLSERTAVLAKRYNRDTRTIRRRIDEGISLLAELAANSVVTAVEGTDWSARRLEAVLRLDLQTPECFERRTIVALREGLDHIRYSITIPPARDPGDTERPVGLLTRVHFGAEVVGKQVRGKRFTVDMRIPALAVGQEHEYGLVNRIPVGQRMRPYYLFFPERHCERFDLRVRFPADDDPGAVEVIHEAFHRDIDEPGFVGQRTPVDTIHEARIGFTDLKPGYGYGLRWTDTRNIA